MTQQLLKLRDFLRESGILAIYINNVKMTHYIEKKKLFTEIHNTVISDTGENKEIDDEQKEI